MPIKNVDDILVNGDLPDNLLLGRLVIFTISVGHNTTFTRDKFERLFQLNNLNDAMLPPEINPSDAWKKATSEAKNEYLLPNGTVATVLCREVQATKEFIRRQITREVRDSAKNQLDYNKAITCTFYRPLVKTDKGKTAVQKGSERVQTLVDPAGLDPAELGEMHRIAKEIEDRYTHYYKSLDSNRVRDTVRRYLRGPLNAIEIKGGVYFVHISHSDELARLQEVVNKVGDSAMHAIPLVDIVRERQMVTAAFEREAADSLSSLAKEARDLMANRKKISTAAYSKIKDAYDGLVARASEHMTTLEISQDMTGAAAQVALDAISDLQVKMLDDDLDDTNQ